MGSGEKRGFCDNGGGRVREYRKMGYGKVGERGGDGGKGGGTLVGSESGNMRELHGRGERHGVHTTSDREGGSVRECMG